MDRLHVHRIRLPHSCFLFRPSSEELVKCLESGLRASGAQTTAYGLKTTPMLHYLVRCINTAGTPESYGEPTEEGYYKKLAEAFKAAVVTCFLFLTHVVFALDNDWL